MYDKEFDEYFEGVLKRDWHQIEASIATEFILKLRGRPDDT